MSNHKYKNFFSTSYDNEIYGLISKEAYRRGVSKTDIVRMAVSRFFNVAETETPIEKNIDHGNEQSKRNVAIREHLYQ